MAKYYKLAKLDGFDFRTGNTINYRENIGKVVTVPSFGKYGKKPSYALCSDMVLHASVKPLQCFVAASIPCSAYLVEGKPVVKSPEKCGFTKLTVLEEIPQEKLADLFEFDYPQAIAPIHPLKLQAPTISNVELLLLQNWDSVWASVGASVGDSIRASVWASVGASVWDSVWDSVGASVWASGGDSVGASVWDQNYICGYYAIKEFFNLDYDHPAFEFVRMGIIIVEVKKTLKVYGKNGKHLGDIKL